MTTINRFCDALYGQDTAMRPRLSTDKMFQLTPGSVKMTGFIADAVRFIQDWQLKDVGLWKQFVLQFGNAVDDDDNGWRCEYWGKMMRGACFVYAGTRDEELYALMESTVRDLMTRQEEDGRVSSYSRALEFHGWDIWGRKYVMLGMEYFLEVCRDEALKKEILAFLCRHADYMIAHIGDEKEGKIEINTASNYWDGLNSSSVLEPFVRLYNLTKEERYLRFADYIVSRGGTLHSNLFRLAYEGRLYPYEYPVTKAYEMMSCFEGLLEYYRVTGIEKWRVAVENFVRLVAASDVTIIGCSGCTHELFDHSRVRQLQEKGEALWGGQRMVMQETCVTVTWMKICFQMLSLTGDAFFADRIEQSMYNALSGAVNTEKNTTNNGFPFDSYSPLLPGTRGQKSGGLKPISYGDHPNYGCCAAIAAAGLGLPGMACVMLTRDGIAVNLYTPGEASFVTPEGQQASVRVETAYPKDGNIRILLSVPRTEKFTLRLRIPEWSENTSLTVNGVPFERLFPGSYAAINREWAGDSELRLSLDTGVKVILPEEIGLNNAEYPYFALRSGAVILAPDARLGTDVDAPVPLDVTDLHVEAVEETRLPNQLAFRLTLTDGTVLPLIDYASAGKTWDERSKTAAWMNLKQ